MNDINNKKIDKIRYIIYNNYINQQTTDKQMDMSYR